MDHHEGDGVAAPGSHDGLLEAGGTGARPSPVTRHPGVEHPARRRPRSLRAALGSLLAAVLIPLVGAGAAFLSYEWKQQRADSRARLQEDARTLRRAIDRELSLDLAVLRTLAASREIDQRDWRAFHALASAAAHARPGGWFALYEPGGQNVVNTRIPFGAPLPNLRGLRSSRADVEWNGRKIPLLDLGCLFGPLETGAPCFSGLVYGVVTKRPAVGMIIPVERHGRPVYVLALVYSSQFFERLLEQESASGVTTALFDRRGSFIARNQDSERFVGLPGPGPFKEGAAQMPLEGVGEALNAESAPFVYAFSRSVVTDVVVGAGKPRATVLAPAWRALWLWMSVLVCATGVGALFAVRLWRRVGTPLAALAHQARSLGEVHAIPPIGIEEVEALRIALRDAARNEQALRRNERRLRRMFEANPIGVVTGDETGRILGANDAYLRIIGRTREDLTAGAIRWDALTPAEHLPRDARAVAEARERGVSSIYEKEYVRSDGGRVPVLVACASFGGPGELVAFVVDIEDRKRAEEALRDANEKLREADRRKDEFLSMLSHELRNPLMPIRSSVYILERVDPTSPQASRARAVIDRQTEHLTRLVDDLLDVTRVARGKIVLHRERVDVRELVSRATDDLHVVIDDRGVKLTVDLPATSLWVDGDPARITQVLGNLLANARKFTRQGDEIIVSLRVIDAAAEITVRDTGTGIEPELLPNLFEPFVQGKRTLARTEGGLGLGLALVKAVVQMHGGSVRAHSEGQDRGAEFVVTFPLTGSS